MKRIGYLFAALLLPLFVFVSCGGDKEKEENNPEPSPSPTPNPEQEEVITDIDFAYGCDPSWVTPMEAAGVKFYTSEGQETECFALLKSVGFNAARFRVWVNPKTSGSDGMCDIDDVLAKCQRAKAAGMKIMIDFHYSDVWADPANQKKPKAWDNIETVESLASQVYNHTKESLTKLKDNGIEVLWVQIGNETQTGMMKTQSDGSETSVNGAMSKDNTNFAQMVTSGTKAVKEVYPNAKTIVHLANGQDLGKLTWALDIMKAGNANYDILGVSLYPYYTSSNWYEKYIDACINNLNKIADTYNKDVMICELGTSGIATWNGKRAIVNTVIRAKNEVPRCKGVFYWEPQCYAAYNGYTMGGFLSDGSPAPALEVFAGKMTKENLLAAEDPDGKSEEDVLRISLVSGEEVGVLTKQEDGTYKGTLTFSSNYANFIVTDKNGKTYGPKSSWDNQYSISTSHGDFNHFWIDGNAGEYTLVFDLAAMTWQCIL
ncbi:MAG: glycosyl hydrolase 53 family protein [Bacteroidales bacterium]|nr:glycosyl hydrolase 53 family protein [Bacteroidales bacterium]